MFYVSKYAYVMISFDSVWWLNEILWYCWKMQWNWKLSVFHIYTFQVGPWLFSCNDKNSLRTRWNESGKNTLKLFCFVVPWTFRIPESVTDVVVSSTFCCFFFKPTVFICYKSKMWNCFWLSVFLFNYDEINMSCCNLLSFYLNLYHGVRILFMFTFTTRVNRLSLHSTLDVDSSRTTNTNPPIIMNHRRSGSLHQSDIKIFAQDLPRFLNYTSSIHHVGLVLGSVLIVAIYIVEDVCFCFSAVSRCPNNADEVET